MGQRTNETDVVAVTETVRTYYDGMMAGDEAKVARAFHRGTFASLPPNT